NPECQSYLSCVGDCRDPLCEAKCEKDYPSGAASAKPYLSCIFCDQCPVSCASDKFNCGPRFPTCDSSFDCGASDYGCLGCAMQGPCKAKFDTCNGSAECKAAVSCQQACGTADCVTACKAAHPQGSAEYEDLLQCGF